jgi:hypothetical protein
VALLKPYMFIFLCIFVFINLYVTLCLVYLSVAYFQVCLHGYDNEIDL